MRIISDWRDYYDVALKFGHDEDGVIYLRKTKDIRYPKNWPFPKSDKHIFPMLYQGKKHNRNKEFRGTQMDFVWVGLAGKTYQGVRLQSSDQIYWDIDNFEKALAEIGKTADTPAHLPEFWNDPPHETSWTSVHEEYICRENLMEQLERNRGVPFPHETFINIGAPVFYSDFRQQRKFLSPDGRTEEHHYALTVNPCLRELHFMNCLDPYTAFQEISMFLGGVLARDPPNMVTITDDKVKRDKAGFDDKSFKQIAPGERKARRAAKRA